MTNIDMHLVHTDPKYAGLAAEFTKMASSFTPSAGVTVAIASGKDFAGAPMAWHDLKTGDIVLNAAKLPGVDELLATGPYDLDNWLHEFRIERQWMFNRHRCPGREIPGALIHEGAHSKYSGYWTSAWIEDLPRSTTSAMNGLEEIRIEALTIVDAEDRSSAQFRRAALRASSNRMIVPDIKELTDERNTRALINATLLVLGRHIGGVLLGYEVADLRELLVDAISSEYVEEAEDIFRGFVALRDIDIYDREEAIKLADRWHDLTQSVLPEIPTDLPGLFDMLGEIIGEVAEGATVAAGWESDHAEGERAPSKERAETVFNMGGRAPHASKRRPPCTEERRAAIQLAKALENKSTPVREVSKRTSKVPPGRLRTRAAVTRSADRSAGRISTAEPWQAKKKSRVETTDLVAGIMTDISGSMNWATHFVASMTYIVGKAVRHVNGRSAAVVFGNSVIKVTAPHDDFTEVIEFPATGSTETPNDAFAALDGELRLTTSRHSKKATRMIFVISDGYFVGEGEMQAASKWVDHMTSNGVHVFWIFKSRGDARDSYRGYPVCPKGAVPVIVPPALPDMKKADAIAAVIKKTIK